MNAILVRAFPGATAPRLASSCAGRRWFLAALLAFELSSVVGSFSTVAGAGPADTEPKVQQVMNFTNCSAQDAQALLGHTHGNPERAIGMFFETGVPAAPTAPAAAAADAASPGAAAQAMGRWREEKQRVLDELLAHYDPERIMRKGFPGLLANLGCYIGECWGCPLRRRRGVRFSVVFLSKKRGMFSVEAKIRPYVSS